MRRPVTIRVVNVSRWTSWAVVVLFGLAVWGALQLDGHITAVPASAPRALRPEEPVYTVPVEERILSFAVNVDWGSEWLPAMLDLFDERDVKVTFFPTGRWAELEPELVKELVRRGHELGNHGYRHDHPKQLDDASLRAHISRSRDLLAELTGVATRLYAPPYGEVDGRIARIAAELGHWTIMWTLDTIDWQRPAPEVIVRRVVPRAQPGAIVLMHPTEPTVAALPTMLDALADAGWRLVPVGDLLNRAVGEPASAAAPGMR